MPMQNIETRGARKWYFVCSYLVFVALFFLISNIRWHNIFFYTAIFTPCLLTMGRRLGAILWNSKIIQGVALLGIYLLLTPIWGEKGSLHEYAQVCAHFLALICFLCITAELALNEQRFAGWVFTSMAWVSVLGLIIYMFIQHYPLIYPPIRLGGIGDIYNPIIVGSTYGMLLIVLYYHVIPQKRLWMNIVYVFLSVIIFAAIILTQSRGPLLALLLSFGIGSLLTRDLKMIAVIFCIMVVSTILIINKDKLVYDLIIERGMSYRDEIFMCSLRKILERPLLGFGIFSEFKCPISTGENIEHPHNLYLATWLYGGLVGLILMISVHIRALYLSLKKFLSDKNPFFFVWVIYSGICIATDYDKVLDRPYAIYLFLWMALGFLSAYEIRAKYDEEKS
jgi:O-antigen ligase